MTETIARAGAKLPSFSLIVETENLAEAEIESLFRCLDSLAAQEPSPARANEVVLFETGDAPPAILKRVRARYPWVTVKRLPDDVGYYDAKMTGAAEASGEVVVFADSDCIYQPGWLRAMVEPFADPAIAVVGGETVIRGEGPYALALRLAFHFDGYSDRKDLYRSPKYYLNNFAFRREVLLRHPLPLDLPLFRGHCAKHAHLLQRQGIAIWRQPRARTTHEPPEGPRAFVWRFLLIGHDRALMQRMRGGAGGRLRTFGPRLASALKEKPTRALWLPAAVPIADVAMALVAAGSAITRRWPDYLLDRYNRQSDGTAVSTDDPARHTAT